MRRGGRIAARAGGSPAPAPAPALALALALTLALAWAGAAAGPAAASLPAGFPDTSFGSGGQAQAPFGAAARAAALALGPGGAITVAGDVRGSGGEAALVARFTSAGTLDTSFAGSGSRIDRFGAGAGAGAGAQQRANAVAVAPDGSTVVAGVAGAQIMVARYRPDGELDGLFGAGGVVLRDLSDGGGMPPGSGLTAVALSPEGQILVAGSVGVRASGDPYEDGEPGEQIVIGRLSSRGVPDSTFGLGGFALVQLGARSARRPARSQITALGFGPGRLIVAAGRSSGPGGLDRGVVARLRPDGNLDSQFGRAGRRVVQLGLDSAARPASSSLHALAVRPDGSVLVAGRGSDVQGHDQVVLARLSVGGRLDESYGRGGVVRTQVSGVIKDRPTASVARAIAPTADGNVLVTGANSLGGAFSLRTTASGRLDCGYGSLGQGGGFGTTLPPRRGDPSADGAFAVLAQPDGHYVAAGRAPAGGLLLARVLGGPAAGAQTPARRPLLRTLSTRYLGHGRAVVYGAVSHNCAAATVRFVASPSGGGRATATRYARVSGAHGPQVVCALLRGLRPGRAYRVRIDSRQTRGAVGGTRLLRAVRTGRGALPQEGCA